jgi:hypothetical protein
MHTMPGVGYSVGARVDGVVEMVVTGAWSGAARDAFVGAGAGSLVLNYALGFDAPDLGFLRGLAVRRLVVIDRRVRSLEPVYELAPTLESLQLTTDPSLVVDLERLGRLEEIWADWHQVAGSFHAAAGLRRVALRRYGEQDFTPLSAAVRLESVVMKDRPGLRSLAGLEELAELRDLGIYLATKLADVSAVGRIRKLKELQLEGCKRIGTMADLAACDALEMLNFSEAGDFPDLEPLAALTSLEVLHLHGSTRILSGDLLPITQLPRLRELRMQNRRSYVPTVPEIQQTIASRP